MFQTVHVHTSAFPIYQSELLQQSLRRRIIHSRLLYESAEQVRKWLALHHTYSPIVCSRDGRAIYLHAFKRIASLLQESRVEIVSLGCGGGNKDILFLRQLQRLGIKSHYVPCDVSFGLTLKTAQFAAKERMCDRITPVVCDISSALELATFLRSFGHPRIRRVCLFFGMLPNLEPVKAHACLRRLLKPGDLLCLSANLVSGSDDDNSLKRILPQYDNPATRDWLLEFIHNIGVPLSVGELQFKISYSPHQSSLRRIEAIFRFHRFSQVNIQQRRYRFKKGDQFLLFFSYRYTPALVQSFLHKLKIRFPTEWISFNQEEGVFMGMVGS